MKILIGDKGNIDFDGPIKMTDIQRENFVNFLKLIFKSKVVEEINVSELRRERVGDKSEWPREWSAEEYAILLEIKDNNKVSEMLGRSWMSVDIKRGEFIQEFLFWASQRGENLLKGNVKELIKKFLEEKELLIQKRRDFKKIQNIEQKISAKEKEKRKLENLLTRREIKEIRNDFFKVNEELKQLLAEKEKLSRK